MHVRIILKKIIDRVTGLKDKVLGLLTSELTNIFEVEFKIAYDYEVAHWQMKISLLQKEPWAGIAIDLNRNVE